MTPELAEQRERALVVLRESRRVALYAHINPDGDTLGSALALAHGLRQLGKEAQVYCADELPGNLAFLPGYDGIGRAAVVPPGRDLAVYVDSGDAARFGTQPSDPMAVLPVVLNIDHHATNHYFGDVNLVNPDAGATGEEIYYLLVELQVEITPAIATCLLTALVTDTRAFRTPSTTPRTLAIAAELFERGAPLAAIVDAVYYSRSCTTLRLWGLALERLRCERGIAWTEVTGEMEAQAGASPSEGDGVIDVLASLSNVQAVAFFRETADGIRVSFRSTNGVDVAAVAAQFAGGGHPRASGCLVRGRLAAVEREVLQCLAASVAAR